MARSNAFDRLVNGDSDENILAAMSDQDAALILQAFEGWRAEAVSVAACPTETIERIVEDEIGGFLRLTMARYDREARREFSDQLLIELAEVPVSLLRVALSEARRKISYPERLVPFIFDFIEARWDKLRTEGERLNRLGEIAYPA